MIHGRLRVDVDHHPGLLRYKLVLTTGFAGGSDGKEMLETWVRSLGWEDLLEEDMAIHCSILAWRICMDRGAWQATVHGVAKSWT